MIIVLVFMFSKDIFGIFSNIFLNLIINFIGFVPLGVHDAQNDHLGVPLGVRDRFGRGKNVINDVITFAHNDPSEEVGRRERLINYGYDGRQF